MAGFLSNPRHLEMLDRRGSDTDGRVVPTPAILTIWTVAAATQAQFEADPPEMGCLWSARVQVPIEELAYTSLRGGRRVPDQGRFFV